MAASEEGMDVTGAPGGAAGQPPSHRRGRELAGWEALISALVGSIPYGILVEDENRNILYANSVFRRMFEKALTRKELVGSDYDEALGRAAGLFSEPGGFVRRTEEALARRRPVRGEELALADGRVFERDYVPVFVGEEYRGHLWHYRDVSEQKVAEEELSRERNLLRTVIDSARDGIFVKDREHRFILNNRVHQEIHGAQNQEELLGKTNADLWGEQRAAPHHADDQRVMETGEPLVGREEPIRLASGEERWWFTTKVPLRGPAGGVEGVVVVGRDITDKRRAEEAFKESEERFKQLFEQSVDALLVHDEEGRYVACNRRSEGLLGYSRQELLSMSVADLSRHYLTGPERARKEREGGTLWQRTIAGEPGVFATSFEDEIRCKDGITIPVEVSLGPIDYGGRRMFLVSARDITKRKRAEAALRQSEERFKQLFEQSADALLVHDEEGRMVECNQEACRSLSYTREELLGMSVKDFVASGLLSEEERRERGDDTLWRRAVRGEPGEVVGYHRGTHRREDGSTFPVEVAVGAMDYRGKRLILASCRDVTGRQRAEEALRESERRLKAVTSGAPVILFALDKEGFFTFESGAGLRTLGLTPGASLGKSVFGAYPGFPKVLENVQRALNGEEIVATVEIGETAFHTTYTPQYDDSREVSGIIGVATDVTERKKLEEELAHRATHDSLTGLPNRALLMDRLSHALARAVRERQPVAVLFLDLDGFKKINDSLGHTAGDELLQRLAGRLSGALRSGETLARFGGDEFAAILEGAGEEEARRTVGRIEEALREPLSVGDTQVSVGISAGVAVSGPGGGTDAGELLLRADQEMYRMKAEEKGPYR